MLTPLCRLCLFKTEGQADVENYLESSVEMKLMIDEIFNEKIKLTQLDVDNICEPCRDRLKNFYEYFKFVLDNQKKFESIAFKDDSKLQPFTVQTDSTEFVPIVKTEPKIDVLRDNELQHKSDHEDFERDFTPCRDSSLSPHLEPEPSCKVEPKLEETDDEDDYRYEDQMDHVVKNIPESLTLKGKTKLERKVPRKQRKPYTRMSNEVRDEVTRERDELIRKFIILKCEKCPQLEPFEDFTALMNHSRKRHKTDPVIKCCNREIKSKFVLVSHLQLHVNVPTCEKCGLTFTTNRKMESHRKIAHAICEICGLDLRRKKLKPVDVWSHYQQHALSIDPSRPAPFICDMCGKTSKDRNRFKAHITYNHYDRVACICELCGISFKFKHQYTEHNRTQHPNGRFFRTILLQKTVFNCFSFVGGLKIPCEICGIAIKNNEKAMQGHIENVHNAQPTACPTCGMVCKSKKAMQTHFKRNHSEKKHTCNVCGKKFNTGNRLKEHEAIHLQISLYTCQWCGAEFKSSGNFSAHKRKLHPVEYAGEKARNQAKKYEL